jgi:hypothetical protein
MIYIDEIKKTTTFENIIKTKTQIDYYTENGASQDILKLVLLNNKSFGEKMQRIVGEIFELDKPTNTGHDGQIKKNNIKFEIKSSRFWVTTKDWRWQHIMVDHSYTHLIFVGINFMGIDVYIITKDKFLELRETNIVTQQGNAEGQGLWCEYSKIKNYLTKISTINELNDYLNIS